MPWHRCSERTSVTRPSGLEVLVVVGVGLGPSRSGPVTSKRASRRLEAVSSGPNTRKLAALGVGGHHVAEEAAEHSGGLAGGDPGLEDFDGVVGGSRADGDPVAARRRWRAGWRPCGAPLRGQGRQLRLQSGPSRRRAPRAGSCAATPPAGADGQGWFSGLGEGDLVGSP